ncbi:MAG TPA: hypothetical protein VMT03_17565 [Polyangia bacterium]|nr:hypothetical protein [Polyangia bacterium]
MRSSTISLTFVLSVALASAGSRAFAQTAPAPVPPPASEQVSASGSAPAPAFAPPLTLAPAPAPHGFSVWGILPWGGYGAGVRYMLPIGIPSLLTNTGIRDNFTLEFGADILRWSYGVDTLYSSSYQWTEILPVLGISWNLWFSDHFALYPKIEAGYAIGWLSGASYDIGGYGGTFASGAAGLLYRLDGGLTLRAEAGTSGLKLGVGWLF